LSKNHTNSIGKLDGGFPRLVVHECRDLDVGGVIDIARGHGQEAIDNPLPIDNLFVDPPPITQKLIEFLVCRFQSMIDGIHHDRDYYAKNR
jgi:hypothetical protein